LQKPEKGRYGATPVILKGKGVLHRPLHPATKNEVIKMGGKWARTKGLSFERQIAIILREFWPNARRQLENHKDDAQGVDIQGTGRFKIQCKKLKKYAPISKMREIKCEEAFGDVPVLVTAGDREPTVAVLLFEDFLALLRAAGEGKK
jgi:hypothetical protein